MQTLETLCVALGFATLSGINLYLVVFASGLAIQMGWVDVSTTYPELLILGEPTILAVAGVLFCLEFFSDKVPWVDSLWDSVHTLIRPVGGALLAIQTLGPTEPAFEVVVGLLAGGTSLITHNLKAGTRLVLNASPEPVSNIVASVGEDLAVLGGLALMTLNPIVAALLFITFLGLSCYLTPKLFRRSKAFLWLLLQKLGSFATSSDEGLLYAGLSASEHQKLSSVMGGRNVTPAWTAEIIVGTAKRFPGFVPITFGRIIVDTEQPKQLHFVGRKWWRHYHATLSLENLEIAQEHRFLSEDIVLYDLAGKRRLVLKLAAGRSTMANRIVESLLLTSGRSSRAATPADIMPMPSDRIQLA